MEIEAEECSEQHLYAGDEVGDVVIDHFPFNGQHKRVAVKCESPAKLECHYMYISFAITFLSFTLDSAKAQAVM